jgi:hypothetical protein
MALSNLIPVPEVCARVLLTEPGRCIALFIELPVAGTVGGIGGGMAVLTVVMVAGVLPMVPGGNLALRGLV